MAITYTWKLTSLKHITKGDLENAIFQTHWKKIGTDADGNVGEFIGATPFPVEQVDPNNFIPYDQLTEEIVLSWIKPVVVGDYERHVNEKIQQEINRKIHVEVDVAEADLPWADPAAKYAPPDAPPGATPEEIAAMRNGAQGPNPQ